MIINNYIRLPFKNSSYLKVKIHLSCVTLQLKTKAGCSNVNVMNIFDNTRRRKRSHDHRRYTSPKLHDVNGLLPHVQKPLGMHHIRTKLYSLPFSKLHSLYTACLKTSITYPYSTLYKLTALILDIDQHMFLKPVTIGGKEKENILVLSLFFANKGLNAINLGNILNHKSVKAMVPPYFKDQYVPIISLHPLHP